MSTFDDLKKRAKELEDELCTSFPFGRICDEVQGNTFDDMCEPCQARIVIKKLKEQGIYE